MHHHSQAQKIGHIDRTVFNNKKHNAWGQTTYSCFWKNYWLSVYNPLYVLMTRGRGHRNWICICISTLWQKRDRSYIYAHFSIIRNIMPESRLLTAAFERIIGCQYITHCMFWRQGVGGAVADPEYVYASPLPGGKQIGCIDVNTFHIKKQHVWGQTTYCCFWENYGLPVYNPLYVLTTRGRGRRPWICICITTLWQKWDRSYRCQQCPICERKA